jgi:hypothetical protein
MKKMLLLVTVLLSLCITGCTKPIIDIEKISDDIASVANEMTISTTNKTIEEGKDIIINYSGLNIVECDVSLISEWGEPIVIKASNVSGVELYKCKITNNLKPGKYYLTLTKLSEKTNSIEIFITAVNSMPYISKIIEKGENLKIYGNNFIKSYIPNVECDGKKAEIGSFTETCIEIKKMSAGEHIIQVTSGELKSNEFSITTK